MLTRLDKLYLLGGRNRRQRQMKEPSLDMALQSGALTDERAAVIRSTGRGGGARSGRDNSQRFCRLRGRLLFPRRKRPRFGAVSERRDQPAQGGHGCLH